MLSISLTPKASLFQNGDTDGCVPYFGAEEWVAQVTAERGWANDIAWSPWTVDGQVAGCESSKRSASHLLASWSSDVRSLLHRPQPVE